MYSLDGLILETEQLLATTRGLIRASCAARANTDEVIQKAYRVIAESEALIQRSDKLALTP